MVKISKRRMVEFLKLCELEPWLHVLFMAARGYHRNKPKRFCANEVWYASRRGFEKGLKARMLELVGTERPDRHPVLSTSEAYDLAYHVIYEQLPDCTHEDSALGC